LGRKSSAKTKKIILQADKKTEAVDEMRIDVEKISDVL